MPDGQKQNRAEKQGSDGLQPLFLFLRFVPVSVPAASLFLRSVPVSLRAGRKGAKVFRTQSIFHNYYRPLRKLVKLMMYVHVWNKYLPIIRILMKKSSGGNQTLDLNRIDFERAGSSRKAGYKFTVELVKGRVANVISGSPLASDLATVLLADPACKGILANADISISLNTKFQLTIINKNPAPPEQAEAPQPSEEAPQTSEEKS